MCDTGFGMLHEGIRMKTKCLLGVGLGLAMVLGWSGSGLAQQRLTASQPLELSVFGMATGTYTGLEDGRNAGFTAGIDLTIPTYFHFQPALELRGNIPFDKGNVNSQKSVLIGPRVSRGFGRFHPYIDGFFGRGEFTYDPGVIVDYPTYAFEYNRTTSNIYAGGAGVDVRMTRHFDLKLDAVYQRWKTPVTTSGVVYSKPLSAGIVYHLDFNEYGRHRHRKHKGSMETAPPPAVPLEYRNPPPPPPASSPQK